MIGHDVVVAETGRKRKIDLRPAMIGHSGILLLAETLDRDGIDRFMFALVLVPSNRFCYFIVR